jgi:hypothetical protein
MPGSTIANQLTTTTPVVGILTRDTTACPNAVSLANATVYIGSGRVTIPNAGGGGTGAGNVDVGWGFSDGSAGVVTQKNVFPTYDELIGTWFRTNGTGTGTFFFLEPNTTFQITNHGLVTGSLLFYAYYGVSTFPVYAIVLTANTFQLATSLTNAQNNIPATFGAGGITSSPVVQFLNVNVGSAYAKFALSLYPSSARSSQAFNINVPVRIDWNTAGNTTNGENSGIMAGLWINATTYYMMTTNAASNFLYSGAILGNGSGIAYPSGFPHGTGDTSYKGRIIITPSRTIEFWMARNIANPTYTLVYTQSALATNTPPLYFVAGFCLNNQRIENCTITYL